MSSSLTVEEEIQQAVTEEWSRPQGGPLLISKLGMRLSAQAKAEISISGHGLKRYVQEHLSDAIRFVPMRERGGAVAPLGETSGLTDEQIEERYVDRPKGAELQSSVPMYWGDVWRGFQTPLVAREKP